MPSNLAGAVNIGQFDACVFRAAKLASDCSPLGGNSSGVVTAGIVTMTATPDVEEGTVYEPKNGCGSIAYTFEKQSKIKRWNLSGEFIFHDWELMEVLFGGTLILGAGGGPYAGEVIGWAAPNYDAPDTNGVYLEVITRAVAEGAGDCVVSGADFPKYIGHVFSKAKLVPGEATFEEAERRLLFSGTSTGNPGLYNGPWNDYPGAGYIPTTGYFTVGYSEAQYEAILADVAPGYVDLPAAS